LEQDLNDTGLGESLAVAFDKFLSPPHMGGKEQERVKGAFDNNRIAPYGLRVNAFEKEVAASGCMESALALNAGTAGLQFVRCVGLAFRRETMSSARILRLSAVATLFCMKRRLRSSLSICMGNPPTGIHCCRSAEVWRGVVEDAAEAVGTMCNIGKNAAARLVT